MLKNTLIIIALTTLLACGGKTTQVADGSFAEKIRLNDLKGQPIDLKQFKGKVVFVNVWATWCKPCIEEMPTIKEAETLLTGKDIQFFFASNEEVDRIQSFAERRKLDLNFVSLLNLEELQIQALPQTYIIDKSGNLVFSEMGYRNWSDPNNLELLNKFIDATE